MSTRPLNTVTLRHVAQLLGRGGQALVEAAAKPTRATLSAAGSLPHHALALPIADWVGFRSQERRRLVEILDLLQLAIDLADNVADWENDLDHGRRPDLDYAGVPRAVLGSLPTLTVAAVVHLLHTAFPRPRLGAEAAARVLTILGTMLTGQAKPHGSDAKIAAVSSTQAELLCLPLWLAASTKRVQRVCPATEGWARAWGTTWELEQLILDGDAQAEARLHRQNIVARRAWPDYGPFLRDQPLGVDRLLAVCVC